MGDWRQKMLEACGNARRTFDWLTSLGHQLIEADVSDGDNARYDGWHLSYVFNDLAIRIAYYEMEFIVTIKKGTVETNYLFLDYQLFDNASGFHGSMFHSDKLSDVTTKISDDPALRYKDILLGKEEWWFRIKRLSEENEKQLAQAREEYERKNAHQFDRSKAAEAFIVKDYAKVVKLLGPISNCLEPSELKKLDYAKKKIEKA
jgi:hypothetical protein